jgi:hypothetical protein
MVTPTLTVVGDGKLFRHVVNLTMPRIPEFPAKTHFEVGTSGKVVVSSISHSFRAAFLEGDGLVEPAITEMTRIGVYESLKTVAESTVRHNLGEGVVPLGLMWKLIESQGDGRRGALLTNSSLNVFRTMAFDHEQWLVMTYFHKGWHLESSRPPESSAFWVDGRRFFVPVP